MYRQALLLSRKAVTLKGSNVRPVASRACIYSHRKAQKRVRTARQNQSPHGAAECASLHAGDLLRRSREGRRSTSLVGKRLRRAFGGVTVRQYRSEPAALRVEVRFRRIMRELDLNR